MAYGFNGKFLRIDRTTQAIAAIDTARYEDFGGGFGIGLAIFRDLAVAPGKWDPQDGRLSSWCGRVHAVPEQRPKATSL
jgi:aldehyde:ferredoxin oxidoreductase